MQELLDAKKNERAAVLHDPTHSPCAFRPPPYVTPEAQDMVSEGWGTGMVEGAWLGLRLQKDVPDVCFLVLLLAPVFRLKPHF